VGEHIQLLTLFVHIFQTKLSIKITQFKTYYCNEISKCGNVSMYSVFTGKRRKY